MSNIKPKRNEFQNNIEASIADNKPSPFVSVIVPVYNDATRLKLCLEALNTQTYPKERYEIIVIDNGSDEEQSIQDVVAQFEQACATYESSPGSYAARNRGLCLAKGEVIAFTDADCIPATNWIEKGVENLLKISNCGLVAGSVKLFFKDLNQPTAVELYESITAFSQQQLLEKYRGAATANVFTFRNVIEQVGNFNASLKSGGDLEWGKRVFEGGYKQVYAEEVQVDHPARHSWIQIYQRTIRLTAGAYIRQCQKASALEKYKITLVYLWQNLIPPFIFLFNTFRDSRLEGLKPKIQVSLVMFFVRYASFIEIVRLQLGGVPARK